MFSDIFRLRSENGVVSHSHGKASCPKRGKRINCLWGFGLCHLGYGSSWVVRGNAGWYATGYLIAQTFRESHRWASPRDRHVEHRGLSSDHLWMHAGNRPYDRPYLRSHNIRLVLFPANVPYNSDYVDMDKIGHPRLRGTALVAAITSVCSFGFWLFGYNQGVMSGVVISQPWVTQMGNPSTVMIGTITSLYDIGATVGAIAAASSSERLGRKQTLILVHFYK
ncbi:hypothetical protein OG21DRAFT_1487465 [Imleria badia]|nr:hypothetical protein OG21DRAFT_1487465 [Imleria badia]